MSTIVSILTIAFSFAAALVGLLNYQHIRQNEFQSKLFQIKIDAYRRIIEQCHGAYIQLDINTEPFNAIYKKSKDEWQEYFLKEISPLYKLGFDIESLVYKETIFLPSEVMDCVHNFSQRCLSFVTISSHYDAGLIIEDQNQIHRLYFEVVNSFRKDLNIDLIDQSLIARMREST
jgi:hypothetical protein